MEKELVNAKKNIGLVVDGTKCPHGSTTFKNASFLPPLGKKSEQTIKFDQNLQKWTLLNED